MIHYDATRGYRLARSFGEFRSGDVHGSRIFASRINVTQDRIAESLATLGDTAISPSWRFAWLRRDDSTRWPGNLLYRTRARYLSAREWDSSGSGTYGMITLGVSAHLRVQVPRSTTDSSCTYSGTQKQFKRLLCQPHGWEVRSSASAWARGFDRSRDPSLHYADDLTSRCFPVRLAVPDTRA